MALSFDGTKVYSAGKNGWVYTYDLATRTADAAYFEIKDPNDPNGPYNADFGSNAILTRQPNGTEILITPYKIYDYEGTESRGALCALDMTNAVSGTPTEGAIDDGPMYYRQHRDQHRRHARNDRELRRATPKARLTRVRQWSFTGTPGTEATALDRQSRRPARQGALELDPYGGNSYDISAMFSTTLGTAYNETNCSDIVVTWDQYKTDKTDNAWVGDEYSYASFQWDGGGDPGRPVGLVRAACTPDWSMTAQLAAATWEPCVMTLDYNFGPVRS